MVGVTHGRRDAERCAAKGRVHLGDQLLEGVFLGLEGAGEIPVETCGVARRVTKLMQGGPVPVDRLEIGLGWRDLHIIMGRDVERAVAADTEVDAWSP